MLDAHLFLQSQLLAHTERFCLIIQNSFFDLIFYLTENNIFIASVQANFGQIL